MASSTAQVIDTEPLASPMHPASDVAGQIQDALAVEEIAVVAPSAREVEVINCNNIDSCDSKRRLLGDSNDEDNDDDDDDVNKGVHYLQPLHLSWTLLICCWLHILLLLWILSLVPQPLQLLHPFQ